MRRPRAATRALLASSAPVGATAFASAQSPLSLERLYSLPSLIGTAPEAFAWSADGRRLAFAWNDPASSVVDPHGRAHDHENLWIVGAETVLSAGCNNGTLTFVALSLRSAAELAAELPPRATPSRGG